MLRPGHVAPDRTGRLPGRGARLRNGGDPLGTVRTVSGSQGPVCPGGCSGSRPSPGRWGPSTAQDARWRPFTGARPQTGFASSWTVKGLHVTSTTCDAKSPSWTGCGIQTTAMFTCSSPPSLLERVGSIDLLFLGVNRFARERTELSVPVANTDTDTERREALTRAIRVGLVPYVSRSSEGNRIDVVYRPGGEGAAVTDPRDDPWNYWVFTVSGSGQYAAEASTEGATYEGAVDAVPNDGGPQAPDRRRHLLHREHFRLRGTILHEHRPSQ